MRTPPPWLTRPDLFAHHVTGGRWVLAPHLVMTAKIVWDLLMAGGARLAIHMPPRHGKSQLLAHWTALLYLLYRPDKSWVTASYAQGLSTAFSAETRDRFRELAPAIDPDLNVHPGAAQKDHWRTTLGGGYKAVGVNTGLTGRGADALLIDDPIKDAREATSQHMREANWQWYLGVAEKRLEPGASVVVIMHRWNQDDLVGRMLADPSMGFSNLCFSALSEADHPDPLGREPDQALWPARFSWAYLDRIRRRGTWDWTSLYQGRPTSLEGGIFKRSWFGNYDGQPAGYYLQSWDLKLEDYDTGSFVVGILATFDGQRLRIVDVKRGSDWGTKRVMDEIDDWNTRFRTSATLIEKKASGSTVLQMLRGRVPGLVPINPGTMSKEARALGIQPFVAEGRVLLPQEPRHWKATLLDEIADFPRGAFNDQVDALTQLVAYTMLRGHEVDGTIPVSTTVNPFRIR